MEFGGNETGNEKERMSEGFGAMSKGIHCVLVRVERDTRQQQYETKREGMGLRRIPGLGIRSCAPCSADGGLVSPIYNEIVTCWRNCERPT